MGASLSTTMNYFSKSKDIIPHIASFKLLKECKDGDLILYRQNITVLSGIYLMPGVARGVLGTLNNQFISKSVSLPRYTGAGIVVSKDHCSHLTCPTVPCPESTACPYLLHTTASGIECVKLEQVMHLFHSSHTHVAWRSLQVPQREATFQETLKKIVDLLANSDGISWSKLATESLEIFQNERTSTNKSPQLAGISPPSEEKTQLHQPVDISPYDVPQTSHEFAQILLENVRLQAQKLPNESVVEAKRAFFDLDADQSGRLTVEEASSGLVSLLKEETNQSTEEIEAQMQEVLAALTSEKALDSGVSLEDFLKAFEQLPRTKIAIENDLMSILSGQFIKQVYVLLKVLDLPPKDTCFVADSFSGLNDDTHVLPWAAGISFSTDMLVLET